LGRGITEDQSTGSLKMSLGEKASAKTWRTAVQYVRKRSTRAAHVRKKQSGYKIRLKGFTSLQGEKRTEDRKPSGGHFLQCIVDQKCCRNKKRFQKVGESASRVAKFLSRQDPTVRGGGGAAPPSGSKGKAEKVQGGAGLTGGGKVVQKKKKNLEKSVVTWEPGTLNLLYLNS